MATGIAGKRFGWYRIQPLWKQNEAWRARRSAMREDFETMTASTSNSLATAQINLATGLSSLAAQASVERTQAVLAGKYSQINKLV